MSSLVFLRYAGHAEFKQVQAGVKCSKYCARWACAELSVQSSASGVMMLNMTLSLAPYITESTKNLICLQICSQ